MTRKSTWDGVERRSGKDRRQNGDRRTASRTVFERRSGQDRRGHKLYAAMVEMGNETRAEEPAAQPDTLLDAG